jgi:hypothetical protein
MVMRDCIQQVIEKAVAVKLAKEFANNVIVALTLWKFDSGLQTLGASEVLKAREVVGIHHQVSTMYQS